MSGDVRFVDDLDFSEIEFSDEQILEALAKGGDVILDASNELVPKRSGDLAASGSVVSVGLNEAHKAVGVQYDSVYSHWVHEHTAFKHPYGGQSKFLETALYAKGGDAVQAVGKALLGHGE